MPAFTLDPRLEADTYTVTDLALSRVLLMNNRLFPWVILVPRVAGAAEIFDLPATEQQTLWQEILMVSAVMRDVYAPYKLNTAMLGNQVRQLHCHIIARFEGDAAWPQPVWGKGGEAYTQPQAEEQLMRFKQALSPLSA